MCSITANRPITLSDYSCTERLVKYKAADAPITFEEIVMVMINYEIVTTIDLTDSSFFATSTMIRNERT